MNRFICKIKNWFVIGMEEKQLTQDGEVEEYIKSLASDNIRMLQGYSIASILFMCIIIACNHYFLKIPFYNLLPYVVACVGMLLIFCVIKCSTHIRNKLQFSYCFTAMFSILWYMVAIYFDAIIHSEDLAIFSPVVFLILANLFNSQPRDMAISSVVAYGFFAVFDYANAPLSVFHFDCIMLMVVVIVGIYLNQRNTMNSFRQNLK